MKKKSTTVNDIIIDTTITTTARLTLVISALMRVRRSPHDATLPLLSVHCHLLPYPAPRMTWRARLDGDMKDMGLRPGMTRDREKWSQLSY